MQFLKLIGLWVVVFVASYVVLSFFGMVPAELADVNSRFSNLFSRAYLSESAIATSTIPHTLVENPMSDSSVHEYVLPDHIVIEKIGVDTPVINPESRDIAVLD